MRASATGSVDFSGLPIDPIEIVGGDGDYERQPAFSGGAWRFAAVHLGGMERLFDLLRAHLRSTGRGGDPHQAVALGQAAIAVETGRLWVERAATIAEAAAEAKRPTGSSPMSISHVSRSSGLVSISWSLFTGRSACRDSSDPTRSNASHEISRLTFDSRVRIGLSSAQRRWVLEAETSASDLWR